MFRHILLLILASFTYGIQNGAPSPDGTLQCQCTCKPVGNPSKTLYTSGHMNVIDKDIATKPMIKGTEVPVNRTITQFQDVAFSKIRHSLGSGGNGQVIEDIGQSPKKFNQPEIKWLHSASSNDIMEAQAKQKLSAAVAGKLTGGVIETGSFVTNKEKSVTGHIIEKPPLSEQISTVPGKHPNIVKDVSKSTTSQKSVVNEAQTKITNDHTSGQAKVTSDHQKPQVINDQPSMQSSGSSNRNSDKVAADIGFVLDGSAPNPVLSGVISGVGHSSMGTGYIVENIKSNVQSIQDKGYFVNKMADTNVYTTNVQDIGGNSNPSLSQPTQINNNLKVASTESQQQVNTKNQGNGNNKAMVNSNHNQKMLNNNIPMNNQKQTENNRQMWNNKGNSWDQKTQTFNQNTQMNKKLWQNENQQSSGSNFRNNNGQTWNREQMKQFQIQRDQKQQSGGWNNNNGQWGNNNWGTTPNPGATISHMPFGMMAMDPLMFLGQHQF